MTLSGQGSPAGTRGVTAFPRVPAGINCVRYPVRNQSRLRPGVHGRQFGLTRSPRVTTLDFLLLSPLPCCLLDSLAEITSNARLGRCQDVSLVSDVFQPSVNVPCYMGTTVGCQQRQQRDDSTPWISLHAMACTMAGLALTGSMPGNPCRNR